uniref:translation initiation factor IF-3 n=1 Tax=Caldinitratiruptor microaerophilus TaxID=671077 RepID=UPI002231FF61|nr:translation initiation factor IF-3 [Caldinitratiruptor microaerophilus]
MSRDQQHRVNEQIRAREVRLVSETGEPIGIMPLRDALRIAQDRGLDLVEVAPLARPPVCRLMDYGKFKYEQSKREREARKKQKVIDLKEIKMRPNIEDHDFEVRVRSAERFLRDGDKIKATIMFRGREIVHADLGKQVLDRLAERVRDLGIVERPAKVEGRNMIMILAPRPQPQQRAERPERQERREPPVAAAQPDVSE